MLTTLRISCRLRSRFLVAILKRRRLKIRSLPLPVLADKRVVLHGQSHNREQRQSLMTRPVGTQSRTYSLCLTAIKVNEQRNKCAQCCLTCHHLFQWSCLVSSVSFFNLHVQEMSSFKFPASKNKDKDLSFPSGQKPKNILHPPPVVCSNIFFFILLPHIPPWKY